MFLSDVDYFKEINDIYGHETGDFVLKKVSDILQSNMRHNDAVCRWGGDEFLFLFNDVSDPILAKEIMDRVRKKIEAQKFEYQGVEISVRMTYGGACCSDVADKNHLISLADDMLYNGKELGRNTVFVKGVDNGVVKK